MGESERAKDYAESSEQGHDPWVTKPQGRGPLAVLSEGGLCDPLKGWARQDTALPDMFSIEQAGIDVTGCSLQLVEVFQASVAGQVFR
ncbi:hypothetical protein [Pseudarthrobacter albicanus]|uniref:hypothetical protein n=1 Tax=Pseudarthrobacter albicanus TaxID=2823873 RepID=UPI001BAB039B|nr:hypothetical protein [Pseudarthrobacter albicanus]